MGLIRHSARRSIALGALIASAGLTMAADAQHNRGYRDRGHAHTRHVQAHSAGVIVINGNRFCLEGRRSITHEICAAFCSAGYRAHVEGGCVIVRYRGCEPRVTLVGCDWGLDKTRSVGCLTLHPYLLRDRCAPEPRRWNQHGNWRGQSDHGHRPRFRPRYQRSRCTIGGITIRF